MPLTAFHYFKVHLAPTNNVFQVSSLPDLKWHQCVDICKAGLSIPALGCCSGILMISAVILPTLWAQHAPHAAQHWAACKHVRPRTRCAGASPGVERRWPAGSAAAMARRAPVPALSQLGTWRMVAHCLPVTRGPAAGDSEHQV